MIAGGHVPKHSEKEKLSTGWCQKRPSDRAGAEDYKLTKRKSKEGKGKKQGGTKPGRTGGKLL